MPPPASRSICKRCPSGQQWHRSFSTTPSRNVIPPESPRFIKVPEPVQTPQAPKPPIKGILPVPRQIFPEGNERYKTTNEYLSKTAPPRKQKIAYTGNDAARLTWKQRMADSRRANLKEGVRELLQRKAETDREMNNHSQNKSQRHEILSTQPPRQDESLTTPTLHNSVRRILEKDPTLNTPTQTGLNKHAKREAKKSEERKDKLHTLYTHARKFIVTEEDMNAALEKAFGTDERPIYWGADGNSIWATDKEPMGTQDMLNRDRWVEQQQSVSVHEETVAQKRMRRIAEEFTGGRIVQ
ncbi:hypothetical protein EJ08DRAFT_601805 [Tothia fuscella]|uniref:Uncharacterized protein n=1 Tax=Tothia fuscella TaxID=1048955 RepID=A0A9P4U4S6_9PEZI|nr:hypothetical protein EJ08DRAFT_601805 [Tothia fuscella]